MEFPRLLAHRTLGLVERVCLGVGDCEAVNTSRFSEFLGLPVALWGLGAYAGIFALSIAVQRGLQTEWTRRGLFLGSAMGVVSSIVPDRYRVVRPARNLSVVCAFRDFDYNHRCLRALELRAAETAAK